ncbi:hypothetical protein JCM9279_002372 [Rhodotorula babjevae]
MNPASRDEPPENSDEDDGELSEAGGAGRQSKDKDSLKPPKAGGKTAEVDSGDEDDEDDELSEKPRGPIEGSQSQKKESKSKLEAIKELPLEMVTEIFSHLYPDDLLALSMVNKQYRALLTAESSTRLWKAARDKLELPNVVPDYFSEIQYASLILGRNCQLCNGEGGVWVTPGLRVRLDYPDHRAHNHAAAINKPHLRAKDVVLQSRGYCLLSDLRRATVILLDLEAQGKDVNKYIVARSAKIKDIMNCHVDMRPFYDKLLQSMPRSTRPFVPLYHDFLIIPSVKPLWVRGAIFTEEAWLAALDDIKQEIEQFRLDLIARAHSIVLEATTGLPDDPCVLDHGERLAGLNKFFSLATSFVCCDFRYCPYSATEGSWWIPGQGEEVGKARRDFRNIGPLVNVLEHLHKDHNNASTILSQRLNEAQPQFHISLPREVACATSALLEINQLDPATTRFADLDNASRGREYVWENNVSGRRRFAGELAWSDLLYAIKEEGEKRLVRLEPPVFLDPPVVVGHPISTDRAPAAAVDANADDE